MKASPLNSEPTSTPKSRSDQVFSLIGMIVGALIPIGFFAYDTYATSTLIETLPESEQQLIAHCGMPVIGLLFGVPMLGMLGACVGFGLSRLKGLM